jgi:hypothetical protein
MGDLQVNIFEKVRETKVKFSPDKLNNPHEYNSCFRHYKENFLDRMKLIKNKEKFIDNVGVNLIQFIDNFFNEMSEENPTFKELIYADKINKKKWLKLIYQLYLDLIDYYETNKNREERPLPTLPSFISTDVRILTDEEISEKINNPKVPEELGCYYDEIVVLHNLNE